MEEFKHFDNEQIKSLIPLKPKKPSKDLIKTKGRPYLLIGIVMMIVVIALLGISLNSFKKKYCKLLGEEYDWSKEVFIIRNKVRNMANDAYNEKHEVTKLEKDIESFNLQISKMANEKELAKSLIEQHQKELKIAIKEYDDRITLTNQLNEQNEEFRQKIVSISAHHG